eukprot:6084068-Amphidinium_carterae.3
MTHHLTDRSPLHNTTSHPLTATPCEVAFHRPTGCGESAQLEPYAHHLYLQHLLLTFHLRTSTTSSSDLGSVYAVLVQSVTFILA